MGHARLRIRRSTCSHYSSCTVNKHYVYINNGRLDGRQNTFELAGPQTLLCVCVSVPEENCQTSQKNSCHDKGYSKMWQFLKFKL